MLFKVIRSIVTQQRTNGVEAPSPPQSAGGSATAKKVLNVGGNNKTIGIPAQFSGWEHLLLDIDPRGNPDVLCDARKLTDLPAQTFDGIYCSHNLEHYYPHDLKKVLAGFMHILKDEGFAHIRVPDMAEVMRKVVSEGLDIEDVLYISPAGPIHVIDVIYGYRLEIERSENDFFAHKTGFTEASLRRHLNDAGFSYVDITRGNLELSAVAFKAPPSAYATKLWGLPRK